MNKRETARAVITEDAYSRITNDLEDARVHAKMLQLSHGDLDKAEIEGALYAMEERLAKLKLLLNKATVMEFPESPRLASVSA